MRILSFSLLTHDHPGGSHAYIPQAKDVLVSSELSNLPAAYAE
jgi:hypothetical protein